MVLLVVEAVVAVAAMEAMKLAERTMVQVILKGPADQVDRISFG